MLKNIELSLCFESPTNPRGKIDVKSKEFLDLVASVIESIIRLITSESSEIKGILKNRFGKIANSSFEEEEK
jgi:hypothetical protein